jgi:hypothetical protein
MGWNSWNRFGCEVNCDLHPFDCISESLLMEMADAMVLEGLKYGTLLSVSPLNGQACS